MYKLLFVLRTSTAYGAGSAIYHVEFDSIELANLAFSKAEQKSAQTPDFTVIKLY